MGCSQSKNEVETPQNPIKIRRKSKKSREPRSKNTQLIPQQNQTETQNKESERDGISGKTEHVSPRKSGNEGNVVIDGDFNRDLSFEDVICDGFSGKTEYYSPNRSDDGASNEIDGGFMGNIDDYPLNNPIDDVDIEDKEVLVEEKIGEIKTDETEDVFGEEELFSPMKSNFEVDEKEFLSSKDKEIETNSRISVTSYAFSTLLSFWKTQEV